MENKTISIVVEMIPVESSNIEAIGYKDWNKELYVKYKSGTYIYHNVKKKLYEDLMKSESKGRFMNENIKANHTYNKL